MKNILLPTDFSDNAFGAIRYAISLFKDEKCTFYILNTYIPVIFDTAYLMSMPGMDAMEDVYKETSLKGLAKTKVKIEKEFSDNQSKFHLISSFNSLQSGILETVEEKSIDLVVMGTQGATGAAGVLFGSNTVHVLSNLNCPLIAVPSEYTFKGINEILFPTDYGLQFTEKHLFWMNHLASKFKAKINILHVYFYGYELDKEQIKQKEILYNFLGKAKKEFIRMDNVDVVKGIEKFQKENPVDLLMLVHNKRSFFDNLFFKPVVKHIGFHLKNPMLVIQSKIK